MPSKQERERDFHNQAFSESTRKRLWTIYDLTGASHACFQELLDAEGPAGKAVLEYGCGRTARAFDLAAKGAHVTGIDISDVAIEMGADRARERGVAERTEFRLMDAEALTFDDDSFDIVCGTSVIHHLDLERAYSEMARVLRPGGAAIFLEPMGHNPVINAFRRRTPNLRTEDEHPLVEADFELARRWFGEVEGRYFHLSSLAAIPLLRTRAADRVVGALDAADRRLFQTVPAARKYAWFTVLRLARPIAA